jgi:hypothetical protein
MSPALLDAAAAYLDVRAHCGAVPATVQHAVDRTSGDMHVRWGPTSGVRIT